MYRCGAMLHFSSDQRHTENGIHSLVYQIDKDFQSSTTLIAAQRAEW